MEALEAEGRRSEVEKQGSVARAVALLRRIREAVPLPVPKGEESSGDAEAEVEAEVERLLEAVQLQREEAAAASKVRS